MGMPKRKGQAGARRAFITRRKAMQQLQLSLKDFRRLCIIKGIYPVEPRKKKKGMSASKTYYLRDDINYLSHEPIIWKFWAYKSFLKKVTRLSKRKEHLAVDKLKENPPTYRMDHIVRERYPTFKDALKDLDDALCMLFLYANFAKNRGVPKELVDLSRRLSLEFMHYVIESKSLRKVFISIKGYYYQAEIMGLPITWIVPHQFVLNAQKDVDMRTMRTFTEFYITLMGFVNYKLYSSINMYYPPKLSFFNMQDKGLVKGDDEKQIQYEYIGALNRPLRRQVKEIKDAEAEPDEIIDEEDATDPSEKMTFQELQKFTNLFKGLKIYLGREVPRESLVFVIRCFGGEVSWDKTTFVGATFDEQDKTITHQIVDREKINNKFMNRYYVQPQWVYDSINAKTLLPVEKYFHDVKLPPHLSPFIKASEFDYVPPQIQYSNQKFGDRKEDEQESVDEEEDQEDVSEIEDEPKRKVSKQEKVKKEIANVPSESPKMEVKEGKEERINLKRQQELDEAETKRLRVMAMNKKTRRIYQKAQYGIRRKRREADKLRQKREKLDSNFNKRMVKVKKGVKRKRD